MGFLLVASCKSQSIRSNNDYKLLSNHSIIVNVNYITTFSLDSIALEILEKEDSNKLKNLLCILKDRDKALASHVILTKLIEPHNAKFSYRYQYDDSGNITETIYNLNGIYWTNDGSKNIILNFNGEKLYRYWIERISKNK